MIAVVARRPSLKLLAALAALVLVGVPILLAVLLTRSGSEPAVAPPAERTAFPAPPAGAVVYSRQLGSHALALGVVPQSGRVLLQLSVVDQQGKGVRGLAVSFATLGVEAPAEPCGAGCYRATIEAPQRPQLVDVDVRGGAASTRWPVKLPAAWPPRDAGGLVEEAERAWRSLRSLAFREDLASDSIHRVSSTWRIQAPDRLAYQIRGGWAAVVIGGRRWDRPPGGRWRPSPQSPLKEPVAPWLEPVDAHLLGTATVRGKPAYRVSFFDRRAQAWFTLALDRRTMRTLDLRMVTTAHFMHDVYSSFNRSAPIRPPR